MFKPRLRRLDPFAATLAVFGLAIGTAGAAAAVACGPAGLVPVLPVAALFGCLAYAVDKAVRP